MAAEREEEGFPAGRTSFGVRRDRREARTEVGSEASFPLPLPLPLAGGDASMEDDDDDEYEEVD